MFKLPRGTRDFSPEEMQKRRFVEGSMKETFESFGYKEVQTPVFETLELFTAIQKKLVKTLRKQSLIKNRVELLMSIPGVGEIMALTWVLEIGDPTRFKSSRAAISYCGLCSAQHELAGKERRGPISKKRNKHLQSKLIEAAKLAPLWNPQLAAFHEKELKMIFKMQN